MAEKVDEGNIIKVWVGRFPSRERFDAYFEETYSEPDKESGEERPISQFAAGQGDWFYDHDFLERSFSPELVTDLRPLLERHSFSTSYVEEVVQAYHVQPTPVNVLILFSGEELEEPRSVSGPDFELHYLGAFSYEPLSDSVVAQRQSVIPATVRLELQTPGTLQFNGAPVTQLMLDGRGLILGCGGAGGDQPYLDLGTLSGTEGLAPTQARIYQDEFDQWVLEDLGRNGLTAIGSTPLNAERTLPWHEDRIKLGPVLFRWNCFPGTVAER